MIQIQRGDQVKKVKENVYLQVWERASGSKQTEHWPKKWNFKLPDKIKRLHGPNTLPLWNGLQWCRENSSLASSTPSSNWSPASAAEGQMQQHTPRLARDRGRPLMRRVCVWSWRVGFCLLFLLPKGGKEITIWKDTRFTTWSSLCSRSLPPKLLLGPHSGTLARSLIQRVKSWQHAAWWWAQSDHTH